MREICRAHEHGSVRLHRITPYGRVRRSRAGTSRPGLRAEDREDVVGGLHVLRLRLDDQHRLDRLVVAFPEALGALVEIGLQRLHRGDDLVGLDRARGLHAFQHRADAGIAERAVIGGHGAVVGGAEAVVEGLGGRHGVLQPPVVRGAADHSVEGVAAGLAGGEEEHRGHELGGALQAELGRLLDRDDLIPAEIAQAQDVRLQRGDPGQKGRVVGGADRVADVGHDLDARRLARALEAAHHLVAVGVVGTEEGDALARFREDMAADRPRGHVRVQGLMEGGAAEILGLVDGVRLADRVVDHPALAGDVVDRQRHRRREPADEEADLVLLDQFQRPGRGLAGVELVVAHQKLGGAALEAAGVVELLDRELGRPNLIVRLGPEGAGQRRREADPDRPPLRRRRAQKGRSGERQRGCGGAALQQPAPVEARSHPVVPSVWRCVSSSGPASFTRAGSPQSIRSNRAPPAPLPASPAGARPAPQRAGARR